MNISILTNGLWPAAIGGMQKHSYYLIKYLVKEGADITVFVPEVPILDTVFSKVEKSKITFIEISYTKALNFPGHYIFDQYQYSKKIKEAFKARKLQPDIIYIQGFSGWSLMWHLKRENSRIPTIINFHGLEMFQKPSSGRSFFINALFKPFVLNNLRLASHVQSLGGKLTGILQNIGINRGNIVELGIGITEDWLVDELGLSVGNSSLIRLVFLGRYERRKGIEELSTILEKLDKTENFHFDFIGPIPFQKQIQSNQVTYHGLVRSQETIKRILGASDIIVCPSYSEGMPTVILEAMASGCAVIASDVGAVSEQVSLSNGWLISPGSSNQLSSILLEAISIDFSTLLLKKKASINKIKKQFLWSCLIKIHMQRFDEIIKARRTAS